VFLSALGLEWDYEREGFVIEGERYLPDFWLPSIGGSDERSMGWGQWLEIKPTWPLTEAQVKLYAATARETGHLLYAACGSPWAHKVYIFAHHHCGEPPRIPLCEAASLYENRHTGEAILFSTLPRMQRIFAFSRPGDLIRAQSEARSARFEFGEAPT
jgi:hypothetical protein